MWAVSFTVLTDPGCALKVLSNEVGLICGKSTPLQSVLVRLISRGGGAEATLGQRARKVSLKNVARASVVVAVHFQDVSWKAQRGHSLQHHHFHC